MSHSYSTHIRKIKKYHPRPDAQDFAARKQLVSSISALSCEKSALSQASQGGLRARRMAHVGCRLVYLAILSEKNMENIEKLSNYSAKK